MKIGSASELAMGAVAKRARLVNAVNALGKLGLFAAQVQISAK